MRVTLDLKLKRIFTLAVIKGSLDATSVAESATREFVKRKLLESFKKSGLTGTVEFDGETVEL